MKIRLLRPPAPNREIWEDSELGDNSTFGTEYPHIEGEMMRVPEGELFILRCTKCGGLTEGLLDFVSADPEGEGLTMPVARRLAAAVQDTFGTMGELFIPQHKTCDIAPIKHETPQDLKVWIDFAISQARDAIKRGKAAHGMIHLLTDAEAFFIPIHDLPERRTGKANDRTPAVLKLHAGVRETLRARDLNPLAALLISEAWVSQIKVDEPDEPAPVMARRFGRTVFPVEDPNRKEAMIVALHTTTFGKVGMGEITRRSGVQDKGPGKVGKLEWLDQAGPSLLLDGLLATTIQPMTPERRERGMGDEADLL